MVHLLSILPTSYPGISILTQDIGMINFIDNCPWEKKVKVSVYLVDNLKLFSEDVVMLDNRCLLLSGNKNIEYKTYPFFYKINCDFVYDLSKLLLKDINAKKFQKL